MKSTSTITSKGQTTIPKAVRDQLQLKTGDRIEFVIEDDGRVVLLPTTVPVSSLKGMLPRPKKAATIEEMQDAIEAEAAARAKRRT